MSDVSFNIITGPKTSDVEVKRSHFLCEMRLVKSEEEARLFIEEVRKKHHDARHNCFAMRIGSPSDVYERFSDDGEPQGTAGRPMLDILKGEGLFDICAVVTRYFGGTLLGTGGLVRAYSDSLKEAISFSEVSNLWEGTKIEVCSDYKTSNRIKYLAQSMQVFTENEIYGAEAKMYFLCRREFGEDFIKKIVEMSAGRIIPQITDEVLCFGKEKPCTYKTLSKDKPNR